MLTKQSLSTTILTIISLLLGLLFLFIWTQSPLASYNLQLIAVLAIIFLINKKISQSQSFANPIHLIVFSAIILLLIAEIGGLNSSLFFLIYFLLFGVALLSSTPIILSLTLGIIAFFAFSLNSNRAAIQLASLLLITPLAIFFGRQYLELLKRKGEIVLLKKEKAQTEKDLSSQETNTLIWLSLNLKHCLIEINENLAQLLADISHLTPTQSDILKNIHKKIQKLIKEGQKVQQLIDKETD